MKSVQKVSDKLKKIWISNTLRGARHINDYKNVCLNMLYMVNDPWRMESPQEQYRFTETNRIILKEFKQVGSLLEIGCGEGHQSIHLKQICGHLTGLDMSARAVKRAKRRCPDCEFLVGDIFSQELDVRVPFDLVVACEVIYYMSEVPAALRRIQALGRNCFVTYYAGVMENLDPQALSLSGAVSEILEFNQSRWRAVWWRNDYV